MEPSVTGRWFVRAFQVGGNKECWTGEIPLFNREQALSAGVPHLQPHCPGVWHYLVISWAELRRMVSEGTAYEQRSFLVERFEGPRVLDTQEVRCSSTAEVVEDLLGSTHSSFQVLPIFEIETKGSKHPQPDTGSRGSLQALKR